jgi:putrescine transport system permease protein
MSDSASLPPTSETAVHHDGRFMRWFNMRGWASITIGAPYLWLLVLFLIPFIIVVAMSFALRTPTSPLPADRLSDGAGLDAGVPKSWRNILLMLVILPFWTSFLLRVYAWMGLMGKNSWFNKLLTDAWNCLVPIDWAVKSIR